MIEIQDFYSFILRDYLLSTCVLRIHCECFKKFEDLIFVVDKLTTKTEKMSFENLYAYGK